MPIKKVDTSGDVKVSYKGRKVQSLGDLMENDNKEKVIRKKAIELNLVSNLKLAEHIMKLEKRLDALERAGV